MRWLRDRRSVVLGLALWLAVRRADPTRAAFLLIGTILLFAPNGYSWYFTWIVPLLCFYPSAAWLLLTVLQFLSYKIFINYRAVGDWQFDPFFQCSVTRRFMFCWLGRSCGGSGQLTRLMLAPSGVSCFGAGGVRLHFACRRARRGYLLLIASSFSRIRDLILYSPILLHNLR